MLLKELINLNEQGLVSDQVDRNQTTQWANKILNSDLKGYIKGQWDHDGFYEFTITAKVPQEQDPQGTNLAILTPKAISKILEPFELEFKKKGWTFTQPVSGKFAIGVPKS